MKKIIFILLTTIFLASCGAKNNETATGATSTGSEVVQTQDNTVTTGSEVKMLYTLRENDANGEILDTNMPTDTESAKPELVAIIGQGGLIPGFEKEIMGMKAGETKTFTVAPEDGYGTGTVTTTIDIAELAPEFTREVALDNINSKVTQTVKLTELVGNPELAKNVSEKNNGDVVFENEFVKIILISKTDTEATLESHNITSPFYPNNLEAGMEGTTDGITVKIEKIENGLVTIRVKTENNPFNQDTFKVGSTATYTPASQFGPANPIEVTILDIGENVVRVSTPNLHSLANKTLYFEVKVTEVKTPATEESLVETVTTSDTTQKQ